MLIAHPGRLLKREMAARGLSANRLAIISAFHRGVLRTFSTGVARSPPTRQCDLAAISAIARNSGSTCKVSMILRSSSASAARRLLGASGRPMRPEQWDVGCKHALKVGLATAAGARGELRRRLCPSLRGCSLSPWLAPGLTQVVPPNGLADHLVLIPRDICRPT